MLDQSSPEIRFALHAVRQASLLVREIQKGLVSSALTKDDRSPVTVADFASQALVSYLLAETFPYDPLVAEENSTTLRNSDANETISANILDKVTHFLSLFAPRATPQLVCDWIDRGCADSARRFWTLDPIDGTKGFLRGDQYVVALALIVDGKVQIGALGCPKLTDAHRPDMSGPGCIVISARNQGAWTTPLAFSSDDPHRQHLIPLRVSPQINPEQARLLCSFESEHTNVGQIEAFAQTLGIQAEPVRMDSQVKYAVLAAGKGELLLRLLSPSKPNYQEKIWDQAAGSLILEEAGGRITDLDGKPLDFQTGRTLVQNRGILASNGALHRLALQALQEMAA